MNEHQKKPWFNDGDTVGGLMATVVMIALAAVFLSFILKVCLWIVTGEW